MALHPQLERDLFAACKLGDVSKMRFYIEECDVSVNAVEAIGTLDEAETQRPLGRSLLMAACEHRHVSVVRYLLTRGDLDVNFTASDGRSALTIAQTSLEEASS